MPLWEADTQWTGSVAGDAWLSARANEVTGHMFLVFPQASPAHMAVLAF